MKMKIALLAASAVAMATPAFAQVNDSSESFVVTAEIEEVCVMTDIADVDLGNISVANSSGAGALVIDDNETGSSTFTMSCNTANMVTISSANQGLVSAETAPAGFTNEIEYRVRLDDYPTVGGFVKLITTDSDTVSGSAGALNRELTAVVTVLQADNPVPPVAATDYSDTVEIYVTPT